MSNKRRLLTIAIPTFNRNELVVKNVEILLPFMSHWVGLLILDNCSEIPVAESLSVLIGKHADKNIEVVRNPINVGGNTNVLRCLEYVESEYIWIIGDDDFLEPNILGLIYENIKNCKPVWINLYEDLSGCQPVRNQSLCCSNLTEFLANLESISELVFVSTNIYRSEILKKGILDGYHYQIMMAPHLTAMLSGLSSSNNCGEYLISAEKAFKSVSNNKDSKTAWPLYRAFVGILSLPKLPLGAPVRLAVITLIRGARKLWLSDKNLVIAFSELTRQSGRASAFFQSSEILLSIIYIDRLYSIISIPIYFSSILLGGNVDIFKRIFR